MMTGTEQRKRLNDMLAFVSFILAMVVFNIGLTMMLLSEIGEIKDGMGRVGCQKAEAVYSQNYERAYPVPEATYDF